MNYYRSLFAIFATFLIVKSGASSSAAQVELTNANFDQVMNQGPVICKFFTPWCGHCRRLAPEWDHLPYLLSGQNIQVGSVNCQTDPDLCSLEGIKYFPTIILYLNEVRYFYNGSRDAESIAQFVTKGLERYPPIPKPPTSAAPGPGSNTSESAPVDLPQNEANVPSSNGNQTNNTSTNTIALIIVDAASNSIGVNDPGLVQNVTSPEADSETKSSNSLSQSSTDSIVKVASASSELNSIGFDSDISLRSSDDALNAEIILEAIEVEDETTLASSDYVKMQSSATQSQSSNPNLSNDIMLEAVKVA